MKGNAWIVALILILIFVIVLILGFVHVDWNAITGFFGDLANKTVDLTK